MPDLIVKQHLNSENTTDKSLKTTQENTNGIAAIENPAKPQFPSEASWTWDDLLWGNILYLAYLHLAGAYGLYLALTGQCKIATYITFIILQYWGMLGITAGAHRLWCHRGYKATWQLKLILTFFNTIAHHQGIWYWVITHRLHHKYSDTDGDPHNSGRGWFFSQLGWVMVKEHPQVVEKKSTIDMSDIHADKFAMIQKKYYWSLTLLISVILPTFMLCYCFGESFSAAWHFGFCFRHIYILNGIFMINSYAHAVGTRPYDKGIRPTENRLLSIIAQGEGWHNYHHVFPWDYKAAELGNYRYNFSTGFIDFFAKIGWAYDLKTVSEESIRKRMARSGDLDLTYSNIKSDDLMQAGAHDDNINYKQNNDGAVKHVWGWNDPDNEEFKKDVTYLHKKQ